MPDSDTLYLAAIIGAFGLFISTVAWAQWFTRPRRPNPSPSTAQTGVAAKPPQTGRRTAPRAAGATLKTHA